MRAHRALFAAISLPFAFGLVASATLVAGCTKDKGTDPGGAAPPPPPPVEIAKAGACASGGGTVSDAVSAPFFPRVLKAGATDYCLDPQGEVRAFGDKAKLTLEDVCTTAVDGECEVYKHFGLKRFVSLRYVDGSGAGGSVEVYLSQFDGASAHGAARSAQEGAAGAYGMFTKRVVADGDPADTSAPRFLDAGGSGAIGTGRAYAWKGDQLAELQYINENESPEQLAKSSEAVLTPLAKQIGAKLPGATEKPASAAALPTASLIGPNAMTFWPREALGLANVGAGAMGYYREGDRRYRLVAIQKADADQAKDVMKTLKGRPGSMTVPAVSGDESLHVVLQASKESPKVEWLFTRKGSLIAGVGDEELLLKTGDSPEQQAKVRLSKDEAIAKLKAWLAGSAATTAPTATAPKK